MAGVPPVSPKVQFTSSTGAPLANGSVTVYLAGTTTLTDTWQDKALTVLNTNPITLDSRGEALVWLDSTKAYKFVLKNAGGQTQWTVDDINSPPNLSAYRDETFTGTGSDATFTLTRDPIALSNVQVSINGLLLVPTTDYTVSGTTLTFTTAPALSDQILVRYGSVLTLAAADAVNVSFSPAGTGAVATTVQAKLRERKSVTDFSGVDKTGATDSTAGIQAAVDSLAAGSVLHFPDGTYKMDGTVTLSTSDIDLDFGASIIDATGITGAYVANQPKCPFRITGSVRGTTTLSSSPAQYATSFTVADATVVQAGDIVYLSSSGELWYTEAGTAIYRQWIGRVVSVSGSTVTIDHPLPYSFDTGSNTVTLAAWNPIRRVNARGGRFYGGGYKEALANGSGPGAFYVTNFDSVTLEPTYMEGFQNTAVRFESGANANIANCTIRGHLDSYTAAIVENTNSGFYGVFFRSVQQGSMSNVTGIRCRHVQDASSSWQVVVDNVRAWGGHRPPFGSHAGASDFVYANCVARSTLGGIQWRGHHVTVSNCDFDCATNNAIAFYDAAGAAADIPRRYALTNNKFSAERQAIQLNANIEAAVISGGTYAGGIDAGYGTIQLESLDCKSVLITGAHVTTDTEYCFFATSTVPRTRTTISITGCTLEGYTTSAARVNGTVITDPTLLVVKNNVLIPNGATNHVFFGGTYASNVVYGPNYLTSGLIYGGGKVQRSFSADYAVVAADAGTMLYHPGTDNNARTVTIPANSSIAFPIGTEIMVVNDSAAALAIAITTDTLRLANGATGSRSVADNSIARLTKIASTVWLVDGTGVT